MMVRHEQNLHNIHIYSIFILHVDGQKIEQEITESKMVLNNTGEGKMMIQNKTKIYTNVQILHVPFTQTLQIYYVIFKNCYDIASNLLVILNILKHWSKLRGREVKTPAL